MAKEILVFGAGKSASALISYFLQNAAQENWHLTLVDADIKLVEEKLGQSPFGTALSFDIKDENQRKKIIASAAIVVSLMPPSLHYLIAQDCLAANKSLLTASYVDEDIKSLKAGIEAAGLLFLFEMGLDPGIDHMSAKELIDEIHAAGGSITSFHSHCGGLVAPVSDDNPWHYKISWNPRNVVMAGKSGAVFKQDGQIKNISYPDLFAEKRYLSGYSGQALCWYPNRDSLSYIPLYGLHHATTFIRTTLRHPDFISGWKNLIELKLTSDEDVYETDGKTLQQFFQSYMKRNGFGEWIEQQLSAKLLATQPLLSELVNLVDLEQKAASDGNEPMSEFITVDDKGGLQKIDTDELKLKAAITLAEKMHEANLTLKQLFFLGMDDNETLINKGLCTPAEVLQFALEKKLSLGPEDLDMVVMLHEVVYTKGGSSFKAVSQMTSLGQPGHSAMAKTVGLPLAIATKMILRREIVLKGLQRPTAKEIYKPVLQELALNGIVFTTTTVEL